MAIKFTNNASAPLSSAISSTSTAIILTAGRGAAFPTLGADDYFYATLTNPSNQLEIVKCTARTGDTLTVVRGQDGTAARAYSAGDKLELRITAAGMDSKLDVEGGEISNTGTPLAVNSTDSTVYKTAFKDNGTTRGYLGASSAKALSVGNSTGTEVVYADQSGNFYATGNLVATSDIRLKDKVETLAHALDTVKALRGTSFLKNGKLDIGFIAQEVNNVVPCLVYPTEDGYLSVAYANITALLVEAVKELSARVEQLESKELVEAVKELSARVEQLESKELVEAVKELSARVEQLESKE